MKTTDVCPACEDTGHVCETHSDKIWGHDGCGAAGMPCLLCCDPIPQDGKHYIGEAFLPRKFKE